MGDSFWVGGWEGRGFGSRHHGVSFSAWALVSCVTETRLLSLSELESAPHKPRDNTACFPSSSGSRIK